ncbi:TrmH family RNA methyltransferase [Tannockella kyphosi]|uniref:TrmH family RNA methyltransferase n=1 Tax=Tannockella kyphosi TaxID=2899121 RepID=UPI0020125C3B|nr:RNA methyltransferase [Tannockella kyphosi]
MITSLTNSTIKELMKLKQKKYRTKHYLVEGEHLVEEALKNGVVEQIISTKEIDHNTLVVSPEVMEKLAFTPSPQSIMAKCKIVVQDFDCTKKKYLLLDRLQDPGNVGTLVRSALAFGYDQVILSNQSVDLYNDKVLRSMQGAHFSIACIYGSLEEVVGMLQHQGVYVVGTALENGQDIACIEKHEKMAIIMGNEGNGMELKLLQQCDAIGYIPIHTIESLNVAIAGGIMMYHYK